MRALVVLLTVFPTTLCLANDNNQCCAKLATLEIEHDTLKNNPLQYIKGELLRKISALESKLQSQKQALVEVSVLKCKQAANETDNIDAQLVFATECQQLEQLMSDNIDETFSPITTFLNDLKSQLNN